MSSASVANCHHFASTLKILIAQQTRHDDVSSLAEQMADMLAFLNEVEPLKKIQLLEVTVASMMKQIEECGSFISVFVGNGFFSTCSFTSQFLNLTHCTEQ